MLPTCAEIVGAVQSHERTARSFVDEALATAEKFQKDFHTFITLTPEFAQKQAEEIDRLIGRGRKLPLAGVPFALKDLFDLEGIPTTCGSPAFLDRIPAEHGTAVKRLLDAGAVCIGKLNMHECAYGFTGENPHFGDCKNPWDPQRIAGGSSSGSAVAVAIDICPFTLGSDTGGSIRHPAALCGVLGLKPTYGRVSRAGGIPLSWTMDHVGPITRTALDAAMVLQAMAGADPADESSSSRPVPDYPAELRKPTKPLRIGVPRKWFFEAVDPQVRERLEAAIERLVELGHTRVDVELPHMEEVLGAHRAIIFSEASAYYRPYLQERGEKFGEGIRYLLAGGLFLPAVDYLQALRVRRVVRSAWMKTFTEVDCLATPTSPIAATRFGQEVAVVGGQEKPLLRAFLDMTLPFNLSGHPALSAPCGFTSEGLPVGIQLVGRPFDEVTILRVAQQYQSQTDWHQQRPPVVRS